MVYKDFFCLTISEKCSLNNYVHVFFKSVKVLVQGSFYPICLPGEIQKYPKMKNALLFENKRMHQIYDLTTNKFIRERVII